MMQYNTIAGLVCVRMSMLCSYANLHQKIYNHSEPMIWTDINTDNIFCELRTTINIAYKFILDFLIFHIFRVSAYSCNIFKQNIQFLHIKNINMLKLST
jgi:hypothetical protein